VNALRARVAASLANERGMTLIEVVIAISILAVLSTAALGVYLSGINTSAALQRRNIAVTVASQVLERANLVIPSTIYSGRTAVAVEAVRNANLGVAGVNQTFRVSDPTSPPSPTQALPLTSTTTLSGTDYTVDTIVGTCFQPRTGGSCTAPGYPVQPATVPAGMTMLSRVIVVVRWTAGATCEPTACTYVASTLVDANPDLKWNIP